MKKFRYILAAALVVAAVSCRQKEQQYYIDDLMVDTANTFAEGSFVQGAPVGDNCIVTIPYDNATGGNAKVSAPENNGLYVEEQTVALSNGSGIIKVALKGTPLVLETSYLQIVIEYKGKTYLSSVEIAILEDLNPAGTVEFEIATAPVVSLTFDVEIPFTVVPAMAAVTMRNEEINGLRVIIKSNPTTGEGTVTLKPSAAFIGGEIQLGARFGARPEQTVAISLSAFSSGDGTSASPYQIGSDAEFLKLEYGGSNYFILEKDVNCTASLCSESSPFNASLDGNGHSIALNINTPDADNAALFRSLGEDATLTGITLTGSVVGKDKVAALAAVSAKAFASVDASAVSVLGANHVAEKIATGAGADAAVIVYGNVPSKVNILAGNTTETGSLGVSGGTPVFDAGETNSSWTYNSATGNYTVTKETGFAAGDITFYVKINDKVRSLAKTINVTAKNLFKSGSGTESDPYIVEDIDQLSGTAATYSSAFIKLDGDMAIEDGWTTLATFGGTIDGDGHVVSGLNAPFIGTLSGTVKNIKFDEVNIVASKTTNTGVVANLLGGTVEDVATRGAVDGSAGANGGDTGIAGIAGQAEGSAIINNCYVDVAITSGTNFAAGGLVGIIKASTAVTMSNSTFAGSISGGATKIGGVLGRKTNTSQGSTDIITGCLVSATMNIGSNTNSNMVGGIFGALQGATVSGNYCGGITIEKSAFTGTVSAGNAVGGIAGVGCSVRDCYVSGTVQATNVLGNSTSSSAGVVAAAKGDMTRNVVNGARITGGPKGSSAAAGIVCIKNGNAPNATANLVMNTTVQAQGFAIYGTNTADVHASGNWRWDVKYADNSAYVPAAGDTYGQDGAETQPTQAILAAAGFDFTDVWKWNATTNAPELKSVGCSDDVKFNETSSQQ